jgi:hypothetical protein
VSEMLRDLREVIRDENVMRPRILTAVATESLTVPQIADVIGYPRREVLLWVMGMRKYGHLVDDGTDDDGEFRYRPVAGADGTER